MSLGCARLEACQEAVEHPLALHSAVPSSPEAYRAREAGCV